MNITDAQAAVVSAFKNAGLTPDQAGAVSAALEQYVGAVVADTALALVSEHLANLKVEDETNAVQSGVGQASNT